MMTIIYTKRLIGTLVIVTTIICLCFLSLDQYAVYFFTPKEAVAKAFKLDQQVIRVGGMVKGQSVQWRPKELSLKFVLSDLKQTNIDVVYEGAPPDMFKENSGVVVEGLLDKQGKHFTARRLFVKHSEEYLVPSEHQKLDSSRIQKSIIKDEQLH